MPLQISRLPLGCVFVLSALLGCDGDSPTNPTATPNSSSTPPRLVRLEIVGPRTVAPGEAIQLGVVAHMSDGTTQDLSRQAFWSSQHTDIVSIDSTGRAVGGQRGTTVIGVTASTGTASTEMVVVPTGTYRLSVVVNEGSVLALDVTVEVIAGTGTGLSDITPVNGRYDLYGVAGDAQIRVSGSGYQVVVRPVSVTRHTVVEVQVVPSRDRVDVSGNYTLAIEGDAACQAELPSGLGVRRYQAAVTQAGPEVRVTLQGADFNLFGATRNTFTGRMDGHSERIVFNLGGYSDTFYAYAYEPRPDVIENLGNSLYLYFVGSAVTTVSRRTLSGTFDGKIRQIQFQTRSWATRLSECVSNRISFVFSR